MKPSLWPGRRSRATIEAEGEELREAQRWEEMERFYRDQIARGGSFHERLGYALFQQDGREREAEAEFRAALEQDETPSLAALNLGSLLRQEGRRDEAIEQFEYALELEDERALNELAKVLADGPRARESEQLFRQAIANGDPSSPAYLARDLWEADNCEEVEALYRMALERGHGISPALELALFLRMREPERGDEARALVREALEAPIEAGLRKTVLRFRPVSGEAAAWALEEAIRFADSPAASSLPCAEEAYRDRLVDELVWKLEDQERTDELEELLRARIAVGERRHLGELGWLLLEARDRDGEAEETLNAALAAGVEPGRTLVNLSVIASRRGYTEEAVARLEQARAEGEGDALWRLAEVLENGERDAEVEPLLREAVAADDPAAPLLLADRLRPEDPDGERQGLLELAQERRPTPRAAFELATLLGPEEESRARELVREAIVEAPLEPGVLAWLVRDGQLPAPGVTRCVREALDLAANLESEETYGSAAGRGELLCLLGNLLEEETDGRAEAVAAYHAGADLEHPWSSLFLGLLLEGEDKLEEARPHFERGAALGDPWSMRGVARALAASGDQEGAERVLREAAALKDAPATADLGILLADRGEFDAAEGALKRALALGSKAAEKVLAELPARRREAAEKADNPAPQ
ncbi:MAG TPA: hypothetical protein VMS60_16060 [Solirubrobacterales bacterium]|nr:hypothetical protein [Solirubrobacterales bacterium]